MQNSVDTSAEFDSGEGMISASVVRYSGSGYDAGRGNLSPVSGDWSPPVCWYEPRYTPEELQDVIQDGYARRATAGADLSDIEPAVDRYAEGGPYEDYNVGEEGTWWAAYCDSELDPRAATWRADHPHDYIWVPPAGENDPPPGAVDPELLAELAWSRVTVPEVELSMNPDERSTVNLPTWMWLDPGTFHDYTVRASLPGGLWSQVTASPRSLTLDPGTSQATLHPGSGVCQRSGERIGQPYTGVEGEPPCGITYRHASVGGDFELAAGVTWTVTWTSSTGQGGDLQPGRFESTTPVEVQEIHSVVRDRSR